MQKELPRWFDLTALFTKRMKSNIYKSFEQGLKQTVDKNGNTIIGIKHIED